MADEGSSVDVYDMPHGPHLRANGVDLHDPEHPIREAVGHLAGPKQRLHLHFGFGLGHWLNADAPTDGGRILIYEPNPAIIRIAIKMIPFSGLKQRNATLICRFSRFRYLALASGARLPNIRFFASAYHAKAYPEAFAAFQGLLQTRVAELTMQNPSWLQPTILQQTRRSLPDHVTCPGFQAWRKRLIGKPGVIVAAGPSLEINLCDLAPHQDKAVLFAVSRAASYLEVHGIEPDFLVHLEAQDFREFIEDRTNLDKTHFLLADQAHHAYYLAAKGRTWVFQSKTNPIINSLVRCYPQFRHEIVKTGGSVATAAFFLAFMAGCNPLILVGQDLAARNGYWYPDRPGPKLENTPYVPGYFGGKLPTQPNYQTNLLWYEQAVPVMAKMDPNRIFINATEGGANIRGFQKMRLAHAANLYFKEPMTIEPPAIEVPHIESNQLESFLHQIDSLDQHHQQLRASFLIQEQVLCNHLASGKSLTDLDPTPMLRSFLEQAQKEAYLKPLLAPEIVTAENTLALIDGNDEASRIRQWAALAAILKVHHYQRHHGT